MESINENENYKIIGDDEVVIIDSKSDKLKFNLTFECGKEDTEFYGAFYSAPSKYFTIQNIHIIQKTDGALDVDISGLTKTWIRKIVQTYYVDLQKEFDKLTWIKKDLACPKVF